MNRSSFELTSQDFFELASQQRIQIIFELKALNLKASDLAKKLESTSQEIHRNLLRLEKTGFIQKEIDNYFSLTPFAKVMCSQIPSIEFLSENREYFKTHDFGGVPNKFVMRIGQLSKSTKIVGVVKVLEKWMEIKKNTEQHFYEVLSEVPLDLIKTLVDQVKAHPKIECQSILSNSVIVPEGRKQLLKDLNFEKFVKEGRIQRRMYNVQTVIVLNEKEACVSFPSLDGNPDITQTFYSKDPVFREWCLDYFRYCWYEGTPFNENKIKD